MEAWWVRYPGVLDAETQALDLWGRPWSLDEAQFSEHRLVVKVQVELCGSTHELTAFYPDSYPYFMPQVQLQGTRLPRHHNPEGYLCLLAHDGDEWVPGHDTLASLLQQQLPALEQVTQAGADAEYVALAEEHVGEPLANFLPYMDRSAILVPDELPPDSVMSGQLQLLARNRPKGASYITAILKQVSEPNGIPLVEFTAKMLAYRQQMNGFWLRLAQRPEPIGDVNARRKHLYETARDALPSFRSRLQHAAVGEEFIVGLLYPDQVEWRQTAEDWLFIWARINKAGKNGRNPSPPDVEYGLVRADWAGSRSFLMRAPELAPIKSKSVLLVGVGAIGSPLALQLAKSGVSELHLVDMDVLQSGNTVRWALGSSSSGHPKTEVIASYLLSEYPHIKVAAHTFRIGVTHDNTDGSLFSDYDFLREQAKRVDLVVDATANYRVNHLLSDIARREDRPYLWLSTTPGAAGGVVGRIIPGRTDGCWHCFQHSLADGSIKPPADNGEVDVQPRGCAHATFVAAGIDSDEVSVLAARVAVATLLAQASSSGKDADFPWDVAVGEFFDGPRRMASQWTSYQVVKHPNCQICGTA
jgi:molybdopterin/thiamine biosynthesis adenylyltransferase